MDFGLLIIFWYVHPLQHWNESKAESTRKPARSLRPISEGSSRDGMIFYNDFLACEVVSDTHVFRLQPACQNPRGAQRAALSRCRRSLQQVAPHGSVHEVTGRHMINSDRYSAFSVLWTRRTSQTRIWRCITLSDHKSTLEYAHASKSGVCQSQCWECWKRKLRSMSKWLYLTISWPFKWSTCQLIVK